jgi:hypothetical protein
MTGDTTAPARVSRPVPPAAAAVTQPDPAVELIGRTFAEWQMSLGDPSATPLGDAEISTRSGWIGFGKLHPEREQGEGDERIGEIGERRPDTDDLRERVVEGAQAEGGEDGVGGGLFQDG